MKTRTLAGLMTAGGFIGLVASFVLAVEKITLLKDPTYRPSCSVNPVVSCGSVMVTPQAEVFGFPNPLLGVAGFAAPLPSEYFRSPTRLSHDGCG